MNNKKIVLIIILLALLAGCASKPVYIVGIVTKMEIIPAHYETVNTGMSVCGIDANGKYSCNYGYKVLKVPAEQRYVAAQYFITIDSDQCAEPVDVTVNREYFDRLYVGKKADAYTYYCKAVE